MWPRARELPTRFSGCSASHHGRFLRGAAIAGPSVASGSASAAPSASSAASGLLYHRHSTARLSPSPAGRLGPVHTHFFGLSSRLRAADLTASPSASPTSGSVRFPSRSPGHGTAGHLPPHRPVRRIQRKKNANPALAWQHQASPSRGPDASRMQVEDECELPMDMECGCKTRRLKEQEERQTLAQAAAKVAAPAVAVTAAAPVAMPVATDVVVTRSTSPAASAGVAFESSFHRRHLPQDCIAFSSPEGRSLFKEAINSRSGDNYMQIYFPLAEQFITQAEPAFCGLATLAMCLNALQIDPGRLWKGPWRWFSEELFDCCTSLAVAKEKGISMSEFICLARCNGVQTEDYRAASGDLSLEQFRALVKRSCAASSEIVVLNYSRKVLGQTGDGHFSPIGGYHAERDMVLLMDVARFKYPPHWVRLSLVYEAMQRVDQSIGKPRGLVVLREGAHATGPTLLKQQLVHADESTTADIRPAPTPCCNSAAAVEAARRVSAALARPASG